MIFTVKLNYSGSKQWRSQKLASGWAPQQFARAVIYVKIFLHFKLKYNTKELYYINNYTINKH